MEIEYLYHCEGCQKPDKDYPDKEIKCDDCQGRGLVLVSKRRDDGKWIEDGTEECWKCDGQLVFRPRVSPIQCHKWARNDAYNIYTGLYCDKCYKHNYPYKRGRYHDESYCGERLEPDE
tara:strand:- start:418 stop:774 length:357 start_codon:yes stop_codon:yes gene_type:complete